MTSTELVAPPPNLGTPDQLAFSLEVLPETIHHSGLMLTDPELPFDSWQEIGRRLGGGVRWARFAVGDWLIFGQAVYSEDDQWAQATEATPAERYDLAQRVTGLDIGTLRNYATVCRAVPHANRRLELGISMHQAVAKLPVEEQAEWLDKAIVEGWDRDTLRKAIAGESLDPADEAEVLPVDDDHLSASELRDRALSAVWETGQPTEDGGALVPAETWARVGAALGKN